MSRTRMVTAKNKRRRALAWVCAASLGGAAVPAFAASAQAPAIQAQRVSLTLDEAIARALQQDPKMVQARGEQLLAAAAQKAAFGAYLPTVSANVSGNLSGANGTSGNTGADSDLGGLGAGVSLSYDLFTGFRRGAQRTQAEAEEDAAKAGILAQSAQTALAVQQTFDLAVRARELRTVAQARVKSAQESLDAAKRKTAAGTGTRSDELRANVELNSAQQSLLEANTEENTEAFALGRLVGIEGPVDAQMDPNAPVVDPSFDADAFVSRITGVSPAVASAQAAAQSANAGITVARSKYLPQVTFGAGYDWSLRDHTELPGNGAWSARVGISIPIFDGFVRDQAMTQAEVKQKTAEATLADTQRDVRATAEQLAGALQLARQKITLAESSSQAADEDLRVQQERYRSGVSTMLELLTSQAGAVSARTELVSARFDYRLAKAQLEALAGRQS